MKESIKFLISLFLILLSFISSLEITVIFISLLKASINALSTTFSFLKLSSKGSVISMSFTLNIDDFKSVLEKFKNRTAIKKII